MTKGEYLDIIRDISAEAADKVRQLDRAFAEANNPVKLGDIISDHRHTIVVDKMRTARGWDGPQMVYEGRKLTKRGELTKREIYVSVWQSNLKTG